MGLTNWLSEGLYRILEFSIPDDMIDFILSIQSQAELEDYMKTLLDFNNDEHKSFLREIINRRFPQRGNPVPKPQKKKINKSNVPQHQFVHIEVEKEPGDNAMDKKKKKSKFVNLYSQEGEKAQVVLLKGRHHCDCQASKHELINNCIECGRIVCKQEGSGPCLFCGSLVCTPEEEREMEAKSRAGTSLKSSLNQQNRPKGWEAAIALRDRLLVFDKSKEPTRIVDDDCDYFQMNSQWLSPEERRNLDQYNEHLQQLKHASRLQRPVTFDFAGRKIEECTSSHAVDVAKIEAIMCGARPPARAPPAPRETRTHFASWARDVRPATAISTTVSDEGGEHSDSPRLSETMTRVQDSLIMEMSDAGRCLSMHQPWASLLVEGIKMHEGRSWYTSHRGRLWIASTARPVDPDVNRAVENQYRALYPDKDLKFPSFYPTGCLLGCVTLEDCLPQEEYQKIYPGGESDSPFVFICSDPISLKLRYPIKGQHKIYNLEKPIHSAAVKAMQSKARMEAQKAKNLTSIQN